MRLHYTKQFVKRYKKLDAQSQTIIKKALKMMEDDFSQSSLRIKKIKGYQNPELWEASANMDLRITFEIQKPETIILRNCGHHNRTLSNP